MQITQTPGPASALRCQPQPARLPVVIFSSLGGALTERFSRRAMMVISDAITAACMAILMLLCAAERIDLWHTYTLTFVRATM